jgi:hypothetical protein
VHFGVYAIPSDANPERTNRRGQAISIKLVPSTRGMVRMIPPCAVGWHRSLPWQQSAFGRTRCPFLRSLPPFDRSHLDLPSIVRSAGRGGLSVPEVQ